MELLGRLAGWSLLPVGCAAAIANVEHVPYGDEVQVFGGSAGRWRFMQREWMQPQPDGSMQEVLHNYPQHLEQVGSELA